MGIDHPRRNALFVLEGFSEAARHDKTLHLVYTGRFYPQSKTYLELTARIVQLGLRERVVITDWINFQELRSLLARAEMAVLPSLYEGFGLPILEALGCGVAVITSNCSSIPEVTKDSALLIDPRDKTALSGAILNVLANPALKAKLIARGKERVKLFPWIKTAQETLAVYNSLVQ